MKRERRKGIDTKIKPLSRSSVKSHSYWSLGPRSSFTAKPVFMAEDTTASTVALTEITEEFASAFAVVF